MDKFGTQFDGRGCRIIGQNSSTDSLAGFQENHSQACGMKFAPCGQTGCSGAYNQNIDLLFAIHDDSRAESYSPFGFDAKTQRGVSKSRSWAAAADLDVDDSDPANRPAPQLVIILLAGSDVLQGGVSEQQL
jgi:hypothetical protein